MTKDASRLSNHAGVTCRVQNPGETIMSLTMFETIMRRPGFEPEQDVLTPLRATGRVANPAGDFATHDLFVAKMRRPGFEPGP
jgi:hypothetical protein